MIPMARKLELPRPLHLKPQAEALPRIESAIVPQDTIAGRALIAVVAIMTFLASLTAGAVMLVRASAGEWQSAIAREVTIQVRPAANRDIEAAVRKASDAARGTAGVTDVRPYTREESARLLEPWLGSGLALEDLPVPRVIVVKLASDRAPDLAGLRRMLADQVPGATLDDHRGWLDRMGTMAGTTVMTGFVLLLLVLAATVLSVVFATRGAMAANRPVIEVLHLIGAKNGFIAAQFQRHFLLLGIKGGVVGGGAAILLFALGGVVLNWFVGTAGADQISALFGTFSLGPASYIVLLLQIVLVAAVTAGACRYTVHQTLQTL